MHLSPQEIATMCHGTVRQYPHSIPNHARFQYDSRLIRTEEWFVALQGQRDGHDFLHIADMNNAIGAIGQRMPTDWSKGFIQVENSLDAFQNIARGVRGKFSGLVVGVTGSAGKTTTRALLASVLQGLGRVHQTQGNFNNHIGVPKTITDAQGDEVAWVIEMGMNHLGEIDVLQDIAKPHIRLITNVGAAHVEGCGSIEGVAQAKGELFAGAQAGDICCVYEDDIRVAGLSIPNHAKIVRYGKKEYCDIRLISYRIEGWKTHCTIATPKGTIECYVPVPGEFMAINACAAVCVGIAAGVAIPDIQQGLANYQPVGMRMRLETVHNTQFVNDSYNANVLSMKAAIDTMKTIPNSILILGDMLEMGSEEAHVHQEVLTYAINSGLPLGLVGNRFLQAMQMISLEGSKIYWKSETSAEMGEMLTKYINQHANTTWVILIKGSRGMKMENIIQSYASIQPTHE